MEPAGGGVSNGYYGDSSGGGGADENPQLPPKDDFEDYMWMANEEEVEKELMKQIEDEQMAQKCYSEMLEEEERLAAPSVDSRSDMWHPGQMAAWSTDCPPTVQPYQPSEQPPPPPPWSAGSPAGPPTEDTLARDIGSLSVRDSPKVQLNPLAAEFVPGQAFQPASG